MPSHYKSQNERRKKLRSKNKKMEEDTPKVKKVSASSRRRNTRVSTKKDEPKKQSKAIVNQRFQSDLAIKKSKNRDQVGSVKTKDGEFKVFKKDSAAAQSFRTAFAKAKKEGKKTFTWNGKKYSTKTK